MLLVSDIISTPVPCPYWPQLSGCVRGWLCWCHHCWNYNRQHRCPPPYKEPHTHHTNPYTVPVHDGDPRLCPGRCPDAPSTRGGLRACCSACTTNYNNITTAANNRSAGRMLLFFIASEKYIHSVLCILSHHSWLLWILHHTPDPITNIYLLFYTLHKRLPTLQLLVRWGYCGVEMYETTHVASIFVQQYLMIHVAARCWLLFPLAISWVIGPRWVSTTRQFTSVIYLQKEVHWFQKVLSQYNFQFSWIIWYHWKKQWRRD